MTQKDDMTEISVKQASEIFKISERAVVYKIQEGSIKGKKVGKKWYISFPKIQLRAYEKLTSEKAPSLPNQLPKLPEVLSVSSEKTSATSGRQRKSDGDTKKKYEDFRDLRAYSELQKLFLELQKEKSFDDNLRNLFLIALEKLAMGFYEYDRVRKAAIYSEARGTLARILNRLVLIPAFEKSFVQKIFSRINTEIMGSVIAIIRSAEGVKKGVA